MNNSQFTVGGLALPITIPAGQSTAFNVALNPLVLERPVVCRRLPAVLSCRL